MNRLNVAALFALCFVPSLASAVDIKNIRPCYGPFGATRSDLNCLPGDSLFVTYDLEGLALDKNGKVSYVTTVELLDSQKTSIFKNATPQDLVPALGGTRMPGDVHVIIGTKRPPGQYSLRVTVEDKNGKNGKTFKYDFQVLPEAFGFVGGFAPAAGIPGHQYLASFGMVNMGLDAKKMPNTEITIRILDDAGKPVAAPVVMMMPRDMPAEIELEKSNFVPLSYPVFLNRPGRFTVDVQANDKTGKKTAKLSFPITVIDVTSVISR